MYKITVQQPTQSGFPLANSQERTLLGNSQEKALLGLTWVMCLSLRVITVAVEMNDYDWLGLGHPLITLSEGGTLESNDRVKGRTVPEGLLILQGGAGMLARQKQYSLQNVK